MKNFTKFLWAIALVALSSCMMEAPTEPGEIPPEKTDPGKGKGGSLTLTIPGGFSVMSTRANESTFDNLYVLEFRAAGVDAGKLERITTVASDKITANPDAVATTDDYDVEVVLVSGAHNIVVLANVAIANPNDLVGEDFDDVRDTFVESSSAKLFAAAGDYLPMWGESGAQSITSESDISITLTRSVAKIHVGVGVYDDLTDEWSGQNASNVDIPFVLDEIVVMRSNDHYRVWPTAADVAADAVSLPASYDKMAATAANATAFTYTPTSNANRGSTIDQIYVPEADIDVAAGATLNDANRGNRMALVIGGRYNGSATTTYYRVDFWKNSAFIDVKRNYIYRFDISGVSGAGLNTAVDAYNSASTDMSVIVNAWDEEQFEDMTIIGGKFWMNSETSPMSFASSPVAAQTLTIRTDMDPFTLTLGAHTLSSTTGGNIVDGAGLNFNYALSTEGANDTWTLTVTPRGVNVGAGGSALTDTWAISAMSGLHTSSYSFIQERTAGNLTPYTISQAPGITNGTLVFDHTSGIEGSPIRVVATPNSNYVFDAFTVTRNDTGEAVDFAPVDPSQLNIIQFLLPASNVTVSAEFMAVPIIAEYSVVRVNNTLWATTNMSFFGNFCAQPTDYGAMFQWGYNNPLDYISSTTDGFHTTAYAGNVWYGSDGVTANQGPCPTGWRLPTQGEINELLSRTYTTVSKTYSDVSGVGTLEFTTTSTDSTYPTKTLVFPDAGYRYTSGSVYVRGANGGYWSSTPGGANAYHLYFGSGGTSGYLSSNDKGYAFSVRCVRPVN